jgi:hypothetical protein
MAFDTLMVFASVYPDLASAEAMPSAPDGSAVVS